MNEELYCYLLYSPRPDYGSEPKFIHRNNLPEQGFASLYSVTKETAEAIVEAGTAAGFKGVVWSKYLWLDVDSYEKADRVEERLNERNLDWISYCTGGRGAHFCIRRDNLPSHLLPNIDRIYVKEHFPESDSSIYTHLHPFRLNGTIHQKTGRRKRLVEEHPGRALILPPFNSKSKFGSEATDFRPQEGKSIFDEFLIMRNSTEAKEGERHAQLVRLSYALRDAGYSASIATWWLGEVNKRFNPPKSAVELEKIVRSIYEHKS
jgi:hypothetical protein